MDKLNWMDGTWIEGDPLIMKSWDQAIWLGAAIFDGARAFEGCAPDLTLHCERAIRSAANLGLKSPKSAQEIEAILREGIRKFPHGTALYLRPFMWAEKGGLVPDPESTRLVISLSATPLPQPGPMSVCLTKYRRPGPDSATTDAKAVGLYAQAGRAQAEAQKRGFDDAVMLGPDGFVAEFSGSNIFIVKDGVVMTPQAQRHVPQRHHAPARAESCCATTASRRRSATRRSRISSRDEMFSTGNYAKVLPVTRFETRTSSRDRSTAARAAVFRLREDAAGPDPHNCVILGGSRQPRL